MWLASLILTEAALPLLPPYNCIGLDDLLKPDGAYLRQNISAVSMDIVTFFIICGDVWTSLYCTRSRARNVFAVPLTSIAGTGRNVEKLTTTRDNSLEERSYKVLLFCYWCSHHIILGFFRWNLGLQISEWLQLLLSWKSQNTSKEQTKRENFNWEVINLYITNPYLNLSQNAKPVK